MSEEDGGRKALALGTPTRQRESSAGLDDSMRVYFPKQYWTRLASDYGDADAEAFAPVLHPGAPNWFNELIDRLQERAWHRALAYCCLSDGAKALDVGCGTGRWLRRWAERGLSPVGVDHSPTMLRLAAGRGTAIPLLAGELQFLPFRDESFDCVSVVTVVQHVPPAHQQEALKEMVRVLRPGGYLILFELIRGHGTHVFSQSPEEWIQHVSSAGAKLVRWFGQEFLLPDRLFVRLAHRTQAAIRGTAPSTLPGSARLPEASTSWGAARRAYWGLRRIATACSVLMEPLAEKLFPAKLATHGVFLFRK